MITCLNESSYIEEKRSLSVRDSYDVIVAGGGVAGAAASIAACRLGAKTLLLEKSNIPGGLATLGLVAVYLPLCDGKGHQVTAGIAEEFLKLSIKYGFDTLPECWKNKHGAVAERYCTDFSPAAFAIALDELLVKEGVDLSYDTLACQPVFEDDRCTHVVVENKSGRYAYGCRMAVDATGDADLFRYSNVQCSNGTNGLTYWTYTIDPEILDKSIGTGKITQNKFLMMSGADEYGEGAPEGYPKYDGTDDRQITRFLIDSRSCLRREVYEDGLRRDRMIMSLPGMAQFRTTRRITGEYELDSEDANRIFPDSIGCVGDWRFPGIVWEIPYRALYSKKCRNLFAAGRCFSAVSDAWQSTRVIPGAASTGQAAGTAAALCAKTSCDASSLSIGVLQDTLQKNSVILHMNHQ